MNRIDVSEIFQNCVKEITEGRATIQACAARYPEVENLYDMLQAMQALDDLPQAKLPSGAARRILEQRLAARMKTALPTRARRFPWSFATAAAAICAVM